MARNCRLTRIEDRLQPLALKELGPQSHSHREINWAWMSMDGGPSLVVKPPGENAAWPYLDCSWDIVQRTQVSHACTPDSHNLGVSKCVLWVCDNLLHSSRKLRQNPFVRTLIKWPNHRILMLRETLVWPLYFTEEPLGIRYGNGHAASRWQSQEPGILPPGEWILSKITYLKTE